MSLKGDYESGWSDLTSDLLGIVLRRLPSLADRIRLGAVCRGINYYIKLLSPSRQRHGGRLEKNDAR